MGKRIRSLYKIIEIGILGMIVFWMCLVVAVGIQKPINNLIPWQMAVGMFAGTLFLVVGFSAWHRKVKPVLWWSIFLVYVVFLYGLSAFARNSHYSFVDYSIVYDAAMELAQGQELTDAGYFLVYPNNFKLALLLGEIFRVGLWLGLRDPYYFALGIGVLQVAASVIAVDDLLRGEADYETNRFPLLVAFVFLLPVYANVQAFYTDQMSFWQAVCALALMRRTCLIWEKRKGLACVLAALAGGICAFGFIVKVTAAIPIIAAGILYGLKGLLRRKICIVPVSVALVCGIAVLMLSEALACRHEVYVQSKETSNPVISWIAIGLAGRGSYGADMEFAQELNSLSAKSEKKLYTEQYIRDHKEQFWNVGHILAKLNWNFADGSLGTKDYTYYGETPDNIVYEFFSPWGKYFWRSQQLCYVYVFMMYLTYLLGAVVGIVRLVQQKELSGLFLTAHLSLFGNILFLMLWEANNRQLYNQMPMLLLGWIVNLILIRDFAYEILRTRFANFANFFKK